MGSHQSWGYQTPDSSSCSQSSQGPGGQMSWVIRPLVWHGLNQRLSGGGTAVVFRGHSSAAPGAWSINQGWHAAFYPDFIHNKCKTSKAATFFTQCLISGFTSCGKIANVQPGPSSETPNPKAWRVISARSQLNWINVTAQSSPCLNAGTKPQTAAGKILLPQAVASITIPYPVLGGKGGQKQKHCKIQFSSYPI